MLQATAHTLVSPSWTGAAAARTVAQCQCSCFDAAVRYYKPDCSLEEAVALMAKCAPPPHPHPILAHMSFCRCVTEVNQRFLVGGAKFKCKVIDKVSALHSAGHRSTAIISIIIMQLFLSEQCFMTPRTHVVAGWCEGGRAARLMRLVISIPFSVNKNTIPSVRAH